MVARPDALLARPEALLSRPDDLLARSDALRTRSTLYPHVDRLRFHSFSLVKKLRKQHKRRDLIKYSIINKAKFLVFNRNKSNIAKGKMTSKTQELLNIKKY